MTRHETSSTQPGGRDTRTARPAPLTSSEVAALWQKERRAIRYYVAALTIMAAGFGLTAFTSIASEFRYVVLLAALVLIAMALYMQLAIRCPRCSARLAVQSPLLLPDACKGCGAAIARPPILDSELDV